MIKDDTLSDLTVLLLFFGFSTAMCDVWLCGLHIPVGIGTYCIFLSLCGSMTQLHILMMKKKNNEKDVRLYIITNQSRSVNTVFILSCTHSFCIYYRHVPAIIFFYSRGSGNPPFLLSFYRDTLHAYNTRRVECEIRPVRFYAISPTCLLITPNRFKIAVECKRYKKHIETIILVITKQITPCNSPFL